MGWLRSLSRLRCKALDAALTASFGSTVSWRDDWKRVARPRTSHYERLRSIVRIVDRAVPGSAARVRAALTRTKQLPFPGGGLELVGYGSGSTVFRLGGVDGDFVLKAYRRTLGASRDDLVKLALEFRTKYETVAAWYADRADIVAPAEYVILAGPLRAYPSVAGLQVYVQEEMRDVFDDLTDEELRVAMDESSEFRAQFGFFAAKTLELVEREGRCADLLGHENVLVVGRGRSARLKVLDYGILEVRTLATRSPAVSSRFEERLSRLRDVARLWASFVPPGATIDKNRSDSGDDSRRTESGRNSASAAGDL